MEENDEPNNHKDNPDPFLFTNSKVMTGHGKAVVCAVGENTMGARSRKKTDLVIQEEKTHLEGLLDIFGEGVKVFAYQACIWCVVSQVIFLIFLAAFNDEVKGFFSNAFLMRLAKTGIVAVVILIVSVPEGLPVAVSIAMAMSTEALKKDHILIKKLESIQTCAMLHDICVGKTGTLTTSDITVRSY